MIVNREIKEDEAQYMFYNTEIKYQFNVKLNKFIDKLLVWWFNLKFKNEKWF